MTASGSINEELHAIDAPKIWLTRLFQPGTAANQSSANQISPSAAIKSKSLADQAFPNHAFLVGTIPHGKSRLNADYATTLLEWEPLAQLGNAPFAAFHLRP